MAVVALAMPFYGQVHAAAARAFWGCPSLGRHKCLPGAKGSSLLARGFNIAWHTAMEMKRRDRPEITHFAMLHADVVPEPGWVDILVEELEKHGADVVSAVVPIKDSKGLTSTAVEFPPDPFEVERRLTMTEVMRLPETFGIEDVGYRDGRALLVNTGCFIADLSKPWCRDVCFTIRDDVQYTADGTPNVRCVPEDWGFSKWLHDRGAKVLATRRVKVHHHGGNDGYPNDSAWGEWSDDEAHKDYHGGLRIPVRHPGLADAGRGAAAGEPGGGPNGAGNRLVEGALDGVHGADREPALRP
jgi:hypothetical protein